MRILVAAIVVLGATSAIAELPDGDTQEEQEQLDYLEAVDNAAGTLTNNPNSSISVSMTVEAAHEALQRARSGSPAPDDPEICFFEECADADGKRRLGFTEIFTDGDCFTTAKSVNLNWKLLKDDRVEGTLTWIHEWRHARQPRHVTGYLIKKACWGSIDHEDPVQGGASPEAVFAYVAASCAIDAQTAAMEVDAILREICAFEVIVGTRKQAAKPKLEDICCALAAQCEEFNASKECLEKMIAKVNEHCPECTQANGDVVVNVPVNKVGGGQGGVSVNLSDPASLVNSLEERMNANKQKIEDKKDDLNDKFGEC